ncbi:MAG: 4Fe-4S binding protein [Desulfovibrio sp.]|jgi:Pyruvate/2-oxoacid:ferredoxin oxidoreductase delta subunit|nr:4Fe-4S binding protein [Desulfovibrio sp.]
MAGFLKVLFRNVLEGPSTDPFPLGATFTPDRLRGRARINPELCMGCGICHNSCVAGAINITHLPDGSGYTITIWQNSCCLCASCRHYCPTGAMSITSDWHSAHPDTDKYDRLEQHTIKYEPCAGCGTLMRPIPAALAKRLYAATPHLDPEKIRHLCPDCRRQEDAKRNAGIVTATTTETVAAREIVSAAPTKY